MADEHGVEMPISREVYALLFQGKDTQRAVVDLMTRQQEDEISV
jgi:glycerol-3-phosphate dehydrogenase (NAD(P)+)